MAFRGEFIPQIELTEAYDLTKELGGTGSVGQTVSGTPGERFRIYVMSLSGGTFVHAHATDNSVLRMRLEIDELVGGEIFGSMQWVVGARAGGSNSGSNALLFPLPEGGVLLPDGGGFRMFIYVFLADGSAAQDAYTSVAALILAHKVPTA